jgi:uncharacterized protein
MSLLTPADGRVLLALARRAIESALGLEAPEPPGHSGSLREARGVFVTLAQRRGRELRGCIGFVEPRGPLVESVALAARAAAFHDPRFPPVVLAEFGGLALGVSVLSVPAAMAPEAVEVGVHGLILRSGGRSGLLLPQVAVEQGWSREAFLEHVCWKAGLEPGTWRLPGAQLLGFTAQVFEEAE